MSFKNIILSALVVLSFTACSKERIQANAFKKFYKQQTGETLKIQKLFTLIDGSVVFKNKTTGEFVAYNVMKFNKDTMRSLADYTSVATAPSDIVRNLSERKESNTTTQEHAGYWATDYYDIYDEDGNVIGYDSYDYWVDGWETSTTTTTYYYDGGGFTFAQNNTQSKDLDAIAENIEHANTAAITNSLVKQFSLSESKAESLANLAVNYAKLEDSRRLTDADKEIFAKKGLNVSFKDLKAAFVDAQAGKTEQYQSLVNQAARYNGMSPEKARIMMDGYFSVEGSEE